MKYDPILHVVLHQPEIPQNAGNIGRTCVALGAKLWLVKPLGFSLDDYYLRRAGLDYWEHLEWETVDDWAALCERLPSDRMWFFTKTGANSYLDIAYTPGDVFVFGNESKGLPPAILSQHASQALRVPMREQVRCLNLANTMAIVGYEANRQFGRLS